MTQQESHQTSGASRLRPLRRLFNQVTPRYDLLNRVFTFGLDQRWRRRAARLCIADGTKRVLDLCCGTADLALLMATEASDEMEIVAADFSETMIKAATEKVEAQGSSNQVELVLADAADLPFPDGHFDAVGIAFAFRNLTFANPDTAAYLSEVLRVLSPKGRFVIVETSQPQYPLLRAAFHAYMRLWVGPLGGLASGNRGAYRYLAESACRFPPQEEVASQLMNAGFSRVECRPLLLGVACIHEAWR